MKKSEYKIRKDVQQSIDHFLIGIIEGYQIKKSKSKKDCHEYVLERAKSEQEILFNSFNTKQKMNSFQSIANTWLNYIERFEDFEAFLNQQKITIE